MSQKTLQQISDLLHDIKEAYYADWNKHNKMSLAEFAMDFILTNNCEIINHLRRQEPYHIEISNLGPNPVFVSTHQPKDTDKFMVVPSGSIMRFKSD